VGGGRGIVCHLFSFFFFHFFFVVVAVVVVAPDEEVWLILIKVTAGLWVQRSSGHNTA